MSKRIAAAALWFIAAWYLGAFVALLIGVSGLLGPILGVAAAVIFGGDPLRVIWTRPSTAHATTAAADAPSEVLAEAA